MLHTDSSSKYGVKTYMSLEFSVIKRFHIIKKLHNWWLFATLACTFFNCLLLIHLINNLERIPLTELIVTWHHYIFNILLK